MVQTEHGQHIDYYDANGELYQTDKPTLIRFSVSTLTIALLIVVVATALCGPWGTAMTLLLMMGCVHIGARNRPQGIDLW